MGSGLHCVQWRDEAGLGRMEPVPIRASFDAETEQRREQELEESRKKAQAKEYADYWKRHRLRQGAALIALEQDIRRDR